MGTEKQRQNTDELTHVGGSKPQKINSYCLCLVRCLTGSLGFLNEKDFCVQLIIKLKKTPNNNNNKKTIPTNQKNPTSKQKTKNTNKKTYKLKREGRKGEDINFSTL